MKLQSSVSNYGKTAARHNERHSEQAVRYWMNSPAISIHCEAQLSEALARMHEHSIRRLPVVDDARKLVGMITDGDIRGAAIMRVAGMDLFDIANRLRHTSVYMVMTDQPISITPDTSLREAALLMIDNKIGGLPVVDDENEVVGLISESDLFKALVCYLDHEMNEV